MYVKNSIPVPCRPRYVYRGFRRIQRIRPNHFDASVSVFDYSPRNRESFDRNLNFRSVAKDFPNLDNLWTWWDIQSVNWKLFFFNFFQLIIFIYRNDVFWMFFHSDAHLHSQKRFVLPEFFPLRIHRRHFQQSAATLPGLIGVIVSLVPFNKPQIFDQNLNLKKKNPTGSQSKQKSNVWHATLSTEWKPNWLQNVYLVCIFQIEWFEALKHVYKH